MKTYITFGQDLQFFQPSFAGKKEFETTEKYGNIR